MEDHIEKGSIDNEKLNGSFIMRAFSKRGTGLPLEHPYAFTELCESKPAKKPDQMIRIPDLKFAIHCHIIQNLIIGKVLCTLIFFVGLGETKALLLLPSLFLEFLGFCGSINLKQGPSIAFITYLTLSILLRILSSLYSYTNLSQNDSCMLSEPPWISSDCDLYGKYIVASGLFILYEALQISVSLALLKKVAVISVTKKEEINYVLAAQKIPRFICWGKLKAWKLVI